MLTDMPTSGGGCLILELEEGPCWFECENSALGKLRQPQNIRKKKNQKVFISVKFNPNSVFQSCTNLMINVVTMRSSNHRLHCFPEVHFFVHPVLDGQKLWPVSPQLHSVSLYCNTGQASLAGQLIWHVVRLISENANYWNESLLTIQFHSKYT